MLSGARLARRSTRGETDDTGYNSNYGISEHADWSLDPYRTAQCLANAPFIPVRSPSVPCVPWGGGWASKNPAFSRAREIFRVYRLG